MTKSRSVLHSKDDFPRRIHYLFEEAASELFLQHALLCDEVKEILAGLRALHDDDEGVVALEVVEELDDPLLPAQHVHQANLQRHAFLSDLREEKVCQNQGSGSVSSSKIYDFQIENPDLDLDPDP